MLFPCLFSFLAKRRAWRFPFQSVTYQIWLNSASGEHQADTLKAHSGHIPPPPLLRLSTRTGDGVRVSVPSLRLLPGHLWSREAMSTTSYSLRQWDSFLPPVKASFWVGLANCSASIDSFPHWSNTWVAKVCSHQNLYSYSPKTHKFKLLSTKKVTDFLLPTTTIKINQSAMW